MPAILTYLPYRKRDSTRAGDDPMHRYFSGHGYACLRVDMRGAGDSDGLMDDEYAAQELGDGKALIAWIAAQPWCTGKVGMIGSSWGGFNALQIAALRPPALAAIVTNCSTDDRYTDDMHYMGGCLLNDSLDWGSSFFARLPRPPDPEISGPDWRRKWQARLEQCALPLAVWLRPPASRPLLEARLGQRGLRGDPVPGLRHRRVDGRLLERHPPAPRAPPGAAARAHRRVGTQVRPPGRPRAGDRLPAGVPPLVRPLAPGPRHRDHARADAARLHAGGGAADRRLSGLPGALGRRARVAVAGDPAPAPPSERGRRPPRPRGPGRDTRPSLGSDGRRRGRRVVPPRDRRLRPAVPDRSARGRRAEPRVRDRAAPPDRWTSWVSRRSRSRWPWTGRSRSSRSGSTTSSPTAACPA